MRSCMLAMIFSPRSLGCDRSGDGGNVGVDVRQSFRSESEKSKRRLENFSERFLLERDRRDDKSGGMAMISSAFAVQESARMRARR